MFGKARAQTSSQTSSFQLLQAPTVTTPITCTASSSGYSLHIEWTALSTTNGYGIRVNDLSNSWDSTHLFSGDTLNLSIPRAQNSFDAVAQREHPYEIWIWGIDSHGTTGQVSKILTSCSTTTRQNSTTLRSQSETETVTTASLTPTPSSVTFRFSGGNNFMGLYVNPVPSLTVGQFLDLSKRGTNVPRNCDTMKHLGGGETQQETLLSEETLLVAGKAYMIHCSVNIFGSSRLTSATISGTPVSVNNIRSLITTGWQYVSIPQLEHSYDNYYSEDFFRDIAAVCLDTQPKLQTWQIICSGNGSCQPGSWYPSSPYQKGTHGYGPELNQTTGVKLYCGSVDTPIPPSPTPQIDVEIRFRIVRSEANLVGMPIHPSNSITVSEFLNKTEGSCFQMRELSSAPLISTPSRTMNSTEQLLFGKGYAIICNDPFEEGHELASFTLSGHPTTIDEIKSQLTPNWQYVSIPFIPENQEYSAEQFLRDLSTNGGFDCTQIQETQIMISSVGTSRRWSPTPPYQKGTHATGFPLATNQGYKVFCQSTNTPTIQTTPTPTSPPNTPTPTGMPVNLLGFDVDQNGCLGNNDLIMVASAIIEKINNPTVTGTPREDVDRDHQINLRDYSTVYRSIKNNPAWACN